MSASRGKLLPMLHPRDIFVAGTPAVASITLSQVNQVAGLIASILGILYLLWKWKKEAGK
jgi:hypothetical protein